MLHRGDGVFDIFLGHHVVYIYKPYDPMQKLRTYWHMYWLQGVEERNQTLASN